MNYVIRDEKISDLRDVNHIVTISWNETYKGLVPDDFLNNLYNNEEERIKRNIQEFGKDKELVLEVEGKIVGFVRYGVANDKELVNCGEVIALYVLKDYQKYGYGKKLVFAAFKRLKELGFDKVIIACLKGNRANEFYQHIGGKYYKDGLFERLNLKENIYLFENI